MPLRTEGYLRHFVKWIKLFTKDSKYTYDKGSVNTSQWLKVMNEKKN